MARKNVLGGLLNPHQPPAAEAPLGAAGPRGTPRGIGALGAVTRSIDALAAKAEAADHLEAKLASGAVIIELQPSQIESSFVNDRLCEDDEAFRQLVEAIRERGQDSPILVRPHPVKPNKYQIAFGHRRARAAELLGIPVRAVVKSLSDVEHVIAQGQENSARADLSFIERALFAARLSELGFSREVMMASLGLDKTTMSKMLSVSVRLPRDILSTIWDARDIGRDRWHELATLMDGPETADRVRDFINSEEFGSITTADARFLALLAFVKGPTRPRVNPPPTAMDGQWARPDGAVEAKIIGKSRSFTIALKSAQAAEFGAFVASRLDSLYEEFKRKRNNDNGD